MGKWQILGWVLMMLLLAGVSVAACLFYVHELYFCVFFSIVLVFVIIAYQVSVYLRNFQRISRMVESIRYGDFALNFSIKGRSSSVIIAQWFPSPFGVCSSSRT